MARRCHPYRRLSSLDRVLMPAVPFAEPTRKATMANPNPSPGTRFRGGASGNPAGSSRRAKFAGEVARISNGELMDIGAVLLRGTLTQLQATIEDPEASVMQRWVAVLVRQSFLHGDASIFRVVIDRVVGRPPQSRAWDRSCPCSSTVPSHIVAMTNDERLTELERLRGLRLVIGGD